MEAQVDLELGRRMQHLLDATADPGAVTPDAVFKASIARAGELCKAAKDALEAAAKAVADDKTENKLVAIAFADALMRAADEAGYLRRQLRTRLTVLRKADREALGEAELTRRERYLSRAFPVPTADIPRMQDDTARQAVANIFAKLSEEPAYATEQELAPLEAKLAHVEATHQAVVAESLDDVPLFAALRAARVRATRAERGLRNKIGSVLDLEQSSLTVDTFLLKTPRRAGSPTEDVPTPQVTE